MSCVRLLMRVGMSRFSIGRARKAKKKKKSEVSEAVLVLQAVDVKGVHDNTRGC